MRVAMVCLGNICRSPMAAAVATAMVAEVGLAAEVTVESYGTAGYHVGEGADPRADAALRRRGWPAGSHRARLLSATAVAASDLVCCADLANLAAVSRLAPAETGKVHLLRSFDPALGASAEREPEIPDPWHGGDADFDLALVLIEAACQGLVDQLAAALA